MLTPQEVAQRSFTKASFGGYNMAMVDDFLDEVTTDYESLYNENALLKQKLGVLSGKIREYQSTEEAMRKTLLAAQEMSDKLIKDTESKCAQMLSDAERSSTTRLAELAQGLSAEDQKLQAAKTSVEEYKKQIQAICRQQLDYLDRLDQLVVPVVPVTPSIPHADSAAEEIQAAVARDLAAEDAQPISEDEEPTLERFPEDSEAPAEDEAPARVEPSAEEEAPAPAPAPVAAPAAPAVEESSVSLYEQLMAHRRAAQEPPKADPTAPTRKVERRSLEFGKDFEID